MKGPSGASVRVKMRTEEATSRIEFFLIRDRKKLPASEETPGVRFGLPSIKRLLRWRICRCRLLQFLAHHVYESVNVVIVVLEDGGIFLTLRDALADAFDDNINDCVFAVTLTNTPIDGGRRAVGMGDFRYPRQRPSPARFQGGSFSP